MLNNDNSTTVLIIDDDIDFNTLVKFVLEYDTNWNILTISEGRQGIAQAQLQQPSVILLDLVMPMLNGLDIYSLLKSNAATCSIPIIFVTAMIQMREIVKSQITEDIEVIIKPFDIMKLAQQIDDVCDRTRLAQLRRSRQTERHFQKLNNI